MGLFLENHKNYKDYENSSKGTNAQFGSYTINNGNYGKTDWAAFAIQLGTSSLFTVMDKIGEGKGGSDDKKLDPETKAKIEQKESELKAVYTEAKVDSYSGLNEAIKNKDSEIKTTQSNLKNIQSELSAIGTSSSIQANIKNLEDQKKFEPENAEISNQIQKLKGDLEKAKGLEEKLKGEQHKLEKANVERVELVSTKGKADNIKLEIKKLSEESTGVSYDVEKETSDIKDFMDALKEFKANPNKDTATKLKQVYENGSSGDNGIDTKSIKKAWKMIEKQVAQCINQ